MLKFPKTVMQSTVDDEMVLMDTAKGEYYGLNKTGTVLLEALLETQDTAAAVARAVALFDAPEAVLKESDLHFHFVKYYACFT